MAKEILCAFGVDVDAVAGWLGSYGGEDSPDDISRGLFAGEVGMPRLINLFKRFGIKTTWFIPGHSIETFPEQTAMVVEAGHEIGIHGYTHENPISMTREQEEAETHAGIGVVTNDSKLFFHEQFPGNSYTFADRRNDCSRSRKNFPGECNTSFAG